MTTDAAGGFGPQQKEGQLCREDFVFRGERSNMMKAMSCCMASSQSSFHNSVAGLLKWVHGLAKPEHSIGFRRSGQISPFSKRHVVPLFSI